MVVWFVFFYRHILLCLCIIITINYSFSQDNKESLTQDMFYLSQVAETYTVNTITYSTVNDYNDSSINLSLDLYRPEIGRDTFNRLLKPCLIIFHGGGFKSGSNRTPFSREMARYFCQKGFVVAVPQYRTGWDNGGQPLCEGTQLIQVEDAMYRAQQDLRSVLNFMISGADNYMIDTTKLFSFGLSAGAIVVLSNLYTDTTWMTEERKQRLGDIDTRGLEKSVSPLVAGTIAFAGAFTTNAPIFSAHSPILMFHGTCDKIVPFKEGNMLQCEHTPYLYGPESMGKTLLDSGVPHEFQFFCGYDHTLSTEEAVYKGLPYTFEYMCYTISNFMHDVMTNRFENRIVAIDGSGVFGPEYQCKDPDHVRYCD